jgi:type VII secretion protein EccB
MASRRDQLHSYQFLVQRVISAFVMREADPPQSPLRRGVGAVFAGIMVTVILAAGCGVWGIFYKIGGDQWATNGAVVVEKETGATFVYFDGRLHPTLNYTSALLAAGRPNPAVFQVGEAALSRVPRGVMVGIAGAPSSLPDGRRSIGLPWTVCAARERTIDGSLAPAVWLALGVAPTGGARTDDAGVLVREPTSDTVNLVWHGRRYRVRQPQSLVPALFGVVRQVDVGAAWLNSLPPGKEIAAIQVDGRGNRSPAVPDHTIGDVLVATTGSGPQYYLVLDDGLAPINHLQEAAWRGFYRGVTSQTVELAEVRRMKTSARTFSEEGPLEPPATVPRLAQPGQTDSICTIVADATRPPEVVVGATVAGLESATPTAEISENGIPLVDRLLVPAGRVAIVRAVQSPTADSGSLLIVTDLGIRYPVPTVEALQMLRFAPQQAVDVPAALVESIPSGPTLDPAAAVRPTTTGN